MASFVLLSAAVCVTPTVPVGSVTVPVNVGEANGAFRSSAVCVNVLMGLAASLVLSTFPKPTIVLVIPDTVPVNVGEANGAYAVLVYALLPNVPPAPIFNVEASVPDNVKLLFTVRDLLFAIVKVALVAGAVIVTLLTVVAVAAPNVGVTNVGEVANTAKPVPVSSLSAPARPAELVKVFCLLDAEVVAAASA